MNKKQTNRQKSGFGPQTVICWRLTYFSILFIYLFWRAEKQKRKSHTNRDSTQLLVHSSHASNSLPILGPGESSQLELNPDLPPQRQGPRHLNCHPLFLRVHNKNTKPLPCLFESRYLTSLAYHLNSKRKINLVWHELSSINTFLNFMLKLRKNENTARYTVGPLYPWILPMA